MGQSLKIRVSTFRFQGTRFLVFLRDSVINIHNHALQIMLEYMVDNVHNFTGETQATFRQFRDYLSSQSLEVDLHDFTQPEVSFFQYRFPKKWRIPAKIENLPNAGITTAAGATSAFTCKIERQKFSITVDFKSGSKAFDENDDIKTVLKQAKEIYIEFFQGGLELLFDPNDFSKKLKSFFQRGDVRST